MKTSFFKFPLLIFILTTFGCTSIREMHYFKDKVEAPANYYRLRVRANTMMTSSRYVSGYFDEKAVTEYFGEIKSAEKSKDGDGTGNGKKESSSGGLVPLAKGQEGSKLVMFMSTNSDAIANQIGTIAENEVIAQTIIALANKEEIKKGNENIVVRESLNTQFQQLEDLITAVLKDLNENSSKEEIELAFVMLANTILQRFGQNERFNSIDEFKTWFDTNHKTLAIQ